MTTADAFEGTRTAKVGGTTLAYRELGEGEPVVFVHGGISDLRVWDAQLPVVGQHYRAIAYSRRYSLPNAPFAGDPTDVAFDQDAEDLAALLRELGAAPAHLVGNSWGAFMCLLTTVRYPELVRSLVLEEPPAMTLFFSRLPPGPVDLLRTFATRPRTALAIAGFAVGTLGQVRRAMERGEERDAVRIFLQSVLGGPSYETLPEEAREICFDNGDELKRMVAGAQFPPLEDDEVRGLHVPVLLVTGEHSPAFLLRITDRLEELLPRAERREIRDASHVMHAEQPAAVNEAILEFLARHR